MRVGNALEHGCGATWLTGSYDPNLATVYWAVGNPCPDYDGDERKGDNLYTSSVVALDIKTGKMKWYFQFTPHDMHDWDAVQPMLLVDEQWQGQTRQLLLHADRNGFFFVLDRTDGKLLLAKPVSKVNWATGYDANGRPILTDHFDSTLEGALVCPSGGGGANWPSTAYSPITKLFYVPIADGCSVYKKDPAPIEVGQRFFWRHHREPTGQPERDSRRGNVATGETAWDYAADGPRRIGNRWRRRGDWSSSAKAAERSRRWMRALASRYGTSKTGQPSGVGLADDVDGRRQTVRGPGGHRRDLRLRSGPIRV